MNVVCFAFTCLGNPWSLFEHSLSSFPGGRYIFKVSWRCFWSSARARCNWGQQLEVSQSPPHSYFVQFFSYLVTFLKFIQRNKSVLNCIVKCHWFHLWDDFQQYSFNKSRMCSCDHHKHSYELCFHCNLKLDIRPVHVLLMSTSACPVFSTNWFFCVEFGYQVGLQ